ncbi:MAG: hypothetical protein WCZ90_17165 [Melioribacteraceae bacterium]
MPRISVPVKSDLIIIKHRQIDEGLIPPVSEVDNLTSYAVVFVVMISPLLGYYSCL